jgi:hypothetical protein
MQQQQQQWPQQLVCEHRQSPKAVDSGKQPEQHLCIN